MKPKKSYYKTKTTDDNIMDRIDDWVGGETEDISLHEHLGLTREQYAHWVESGYL